MTHDELNRAILSIKADAKFAYQGDGSSLGPHTAANGDKCAGLTWMDAAPAPTWADVQAAAATLQAPSKPLSVADLKAALIAKGVLTDNDLAAVLSGK